MIPYGRQWIDEDDVAAVAAALRGDWLTQGPTIAAFEADLCEVTGAPYAVAVSSGTAALHLACLAAGVGPGDHGVTSDVTFVASANGIRYAGGTPVLADVLAESGLTTPALASAAVGDRPQKVWIPVDLCGAVADLPGFAALAAASGGRVIEDAAHALGATYTHAGQTYRAGSCAHTDFSILSFHPVKHITTIEGGAILCRDAGAYQLLTELRSHGITRDPARLSRVDGPWSYEQQTLGYHYRIGDIPCALGRSQLRKLPAFLARRREIARRYDAGIAARGLPLDAVPGDRDASAWHLYVVRLRPRPGESTAQLAVRRRALYDDLRARGVLCQVHYIPVHHHPDFASFLPENASFPGAEAWYASCLSIPMYPALSDSQVDHVLDALAAALGV